MSNHQPRITKQGNEFYALVVRIDKDGQENVLHGFRGFYKTEKNALRAANKFIEKNR